MKKDVSTPQTEIPEPTAPIFNLSAAETVHRFLIENNIVQKLTIMDEKNSWVGDGVVLNDKPLLKITYEYKESNAS